MIAIRMAGLITDAITGLAGSFLLARSGSHVTERGDGTQVMQSAVHFWSMTVGPKEGIALYQVSPIGVTSEHPLAAKAG
jgi:hypothetical protein